jgi:hypothetical protein
MGPVCTEMWPWDVTGATVGTRPDAPDAALMLRGIAPGVNLLVQAASEYERWSAKPDGVTDNGNFGRINLQAPRPGSSDTYTAAELRFAFEHDGDSMAYVVEHTELVVRNRAQSQSRPRPHPRPWRAATPSTCLAKPPEPALRTRPLRPLGHARARVRMCACA